MTVHAILLVPAEGDPLGLLAEGPCGARPPVAWNGHNNGAPDVWWPHPGTPGTARYDTLALVLAWDGKPVPEGLDRLERCSGRTRNAEAWVSHAMAGRSWGAHRLGEWGRLVRLDADGHEVSP